MSNDNQQAELRAHQAALKLVRRALNLPDESPDDGNDLRERLAEVAGMKAENEQMRRRLDRIPGIGYFTTAIDADGWEDVLPAIDKLKADNARLRQQVREIGERVKVECMKQAANQEAYWRNRPNYDSVKEARANEAALICAKISGGVIVADLAACGAKADGKPICPDCKGPLQQVTCQSFSYLNPDQFDSVKAGDYYCTECKGKRGNTGYRYYWKSELTPAPPAETEAEGNG